MNITTKTLAPNPVLAQEGAVTAVVTIDKDCADARSTGQTHRLQAGLALGIITATGKYSLYKETGTDNGCRVMAAILAEDVNMKGNDESQAVADQKARVIVFGKVKESACGGLDNNGKANVAKNGSGLAWIIFE